MRKTYTPIMQIRQEKQTLIEDSDIKKHLKKAEFSEIKIVYFGTPEFSAIVLDLLIKHFDQTNSPKYTLQAVVTSPDAPIGRKQILTSSLTSNVAEESGIPTLKPEKLNEEFIKKHLSILECDLFVVAAYGKIIPKKLLDIPYLGTINIHGSILPYYRGASPIQTAILNGDKQTGVTIMKMDEKMDHGPILTTSKLDISKLDTYESLSKKMAVLGANTLLRILPDYISGKITPKPQDHEKATLCSLIKKEAGYFDIENPPLAEKLDCMIRAYYPWPNVWTKWNGKVVKFYPEKLIQIEGKNPIPLKSFLNGYPDFPLKDL